MKRTLALVLSLLMVLSMASFAAAEETVTIKWYAFPTFAQPDDAAAGTYEQSVIDAFQEKNPNIKVELTMVDFQTGPEALVTALEVPGSVDVIFDAPGRLVEYGKNGKLVALNELFTDEYKADVNNAALIEACGDGSNYWMYPISTSPFYMGLNKDAFEKAGALEFVNQEGDRTWTTENFLKALDKLNEAGLRGPSIYCGGQGGDQGTRALVSNLFGATIANPERTRYTINSEEGKQALNLIKEYADAGKMEKGTDIVAGDEIKLFTQEQLSMSICWGTSAALKNKTSFEILSVPFPSNDGVPELEYLVSGFSVVNNNDEKRTAAATEFVKFICDDAVWGKQSILQTGAFPVRSSFGNLYEGNAEYEMLANWTKYYAPYYNTMDGFANMRKEWWGMLQAILTGDKTVEVALADYDAAVNK